MKVYVSLLISLFLTTAVSADIVFYTSEADWLAATQGVESFVFSPENIATANEVPLPPLPNENLGTTVLTFDSVNSGLSRSFTLTATAANHTWNYQERGLPELANTLSPGDVDTPLLHDDDFEVVLNSGPSLTAFAFDIINNGSMLEKELFSVFGDNGNLLGSTELPILGGTTPAFLGVVSDSAIGRLFTDEDSQGDDVFYSHFRFGIKAIPKYSVCSLDVIAFSSFDTDLDGWTADWPTISWDDSGGNPGGFAHFDDDNSEASEFYAPAGFLGDYLSKNVQLIEFDYIVLSTGAYSGVIPVSLFLDGPGGRAAWNGPNPEELIGQGWVSFSVELVESNWTLESGTWLALLEDVDSFSITADPFSTTTGTGEKTGLDNVSLSSERISGINFTSSTNADAVQILGNLQQQIESIDSFPPSIGYVTLNRHADLHIQSSFNCFDGDGAITDFTGKIKILRQPPADVNNGKQPNNRKIQVFSERVRLFADNDIAVDVTESGTFNMNNPTPGGLIQSGAYLSSHFLHFDTTSDTSSATLMGSLTFESNVLGIIINSDPLDWTDDSDPSNGPFLGSPDTLYPTGHPRRNWEIGGKVGFVTLSNDRRTVTVKGLVDDFLDQIRIVTAASPANILDEPYVAPNEFIDGADEVTFDNCSSAWYRFTFELPANFGNPSLSGIANVDDVAVAYLNGNQITASVDINDLGIDQTDEQGRRLLSWPTTDPFGSCESAHFVPGTNELIFGVVGDLSPFDPTGLEFTATVRFTTVTVPISFNVTRGQYVSGTVLDLASSDNLDLVVRRSPSDIQSRAFVEFKGTSPTETPSQLSFTLEAAVFARSSVGQSIDLFNYQTNQFEEFDTRPARRFTDQVVIVEPGGDLSRFVEPGTKSIEARVRFQSANPRQQFSANIDQTVWSID